MKPVAEMPDAEMRQARAACDILAEMQNTGTEIHADVNTVAKTHVKETTQRTCDVISGKKDLIHDLQIDETDGIAQVMSVQKETEAKEVAAPEETEAADETKEVKD